MRKEFLREQVISLNSRRHIFAMDTHGNSHEHMLRSFRNAIVDTEEVRPFQSLESKIVVVEVPVVDDGRVELLRVGHDVVVGQLGNHGGVLAGLGVDVVVEVFNDSRKLFLGFFLEIGNGDTGCEYCIVRMGCLADG
jgi:hypothetical protein